MVGSAEWLRSEILNRMDSGDVASLLEVTQAGSADLGVLAQILEEASAWLRSRGIEQWPKRFSPEWIGRPVERDETWLAYIGGDVVGTLTLARSDPAWTDGHPAATYLHRLAVGRAFAGVGTDLLLRILPKPAQTAVFWTVAVVVGGLGLYFLDAAWGMTGNISGYYGRRFREEWQF